MTTLSATRPKTHAIGAERPLVLGYHAISSSWPSNLAVPVRRLEEQLRYVKSRGYVGLTATEAETARREGTLPTRAVVVTFDDGYASTLLAAPILEELGFPGTVFVVTSFMETGEPMDWAGIAEWRRPDTVEELRSMTWSDAEMLVEGGWEVGSHTVTHPLLTKSGDDFLRTELSESRAEIEKHLGSCTSIAYPYGLADERVAAEARRAGYEVAYMLTLAQIADEPMRRPRVGMAPGDHGARIKLQLSDFGLAARRSGVARLARKLRFRRSWLPDE